MDPYVSFPTTHFNHGRAFSYTVHLDLGIKVLHRLCFRHQFVSCGLKENFNPSYVLGKAVKRYSQGCQNRHIDSSMLGDIKNFFEHHVLWAQDFKWVCLVGLSRVQYNTVHPGAENKRRDPHGLPITTTKLWRCWAWLHERRARKSTCIGERERERKRDDRDYTLPTFRLYFSLRIHQFSEKEVLYLLTWYCIVDRILRVKIFL